MNKTLRQLAMLSIGFMIGAGTLVYAASVWQGTSSIQDGQVISANVIKDNFDYLYSMTASSSLFGVGGTKSEGKIIAVVDGTGTVEWVTPTVVNGENHNVEGWEILPLISADFKADTGYAPNTGPYAGGGEVYNDQASRDQICRLYVPNGYSVSYTSGAWYSPHDNYSYVYDGSKWRAEVSTGPCSMQSCTGKGCSEGPKTIKVCSYAYNNLVSSVVCASPNTLEFTRD